jgi:hypothetical protein
MKQASVFLIWMTVILVGACVARSQDPLQKYRAGRYKGTALNTTANARGKVDFELFDIDQTNGRARAYFIATEGLEGEAWLTGRIENNGELKLSGTLETYRMEVHGHLTPNGSIRADYLLEGANPQQGNFEISFVSALPTDMAEDSGFRTSAVSNLIGAWEVGGALPAQVNPVTGISTGVSFVDVHRLEFFPDRSFKHLWSHRHCDGPRCCSDQAMLETGSYSLDGQNLNLNITGGNLINTDVCNPRMNGHTPVKQRTETFGVSMRGSQLCLQGKQPAACYQKQS